MAENISSPLDPRFEHVEKSSVFCAPILHVTRTASTMQDARELADRGYPDGTVVYADSQDAGRGRVAGRVWESRSGQDLLCTVLLRRPPIPGFTLRVGLAVARTFDHFLPYKSTTEIKWPNDILYNGKKLSGILCESDGSVLYVGTGLNIGEMHFPGELTEKATSLALILASSVLPNQPQTCLPSIQDVLNTYLHELAAALAEADWHQAVSSRLYRRGHQIRFLSGDPERQEWLTGTVIGIGKAGELLFIPKDAAPEGTPIRLFSGEIPY